jgi:hypothetical protein
VADQQQQRWVRLTMYPVESEGARVDRKLRKHELFLLDIPLKELPSFFFEVAMMLLK